MRNRPEKCKLQMCLRTMLLALFSPTGAGISKLFPTYFELGPEQYAFCLCAQYCCRYLCPIQ